MYAAGLGYRRAPRVILGRSPGGGLMDELSLAQQVVDTISARVQGRVTKVGLEIGRLSGVQPDSVRYCFDLVCADSPLEGARLDIVEPPGRARCRRCAAEFDADDLVVVCACGSADVALLGGDELRISAVEIALDVA
jgi:hydrogenase nickel incorporation protein HypA/HybF